MYYSLSIGYSVIYFGVLLIVLKDDIVATGEDYNSNKGHHHSVPHGLGPCVPNEDGTLTFEHKIQPQNYPALSRTPCKDGFASSFPCRNVDLESFLPTEDLTGTGNSEYLNDIWGWTDTSTNIDYALVGMFGGTAFVELSDPTSPKLVGYLATHTDSSDWRDIKTFGDHAFIVSEANGHGMQVFDLTQLAGLSSFTTLSETAYYNDQGLGQAHNIFINEDSGIAYVVGAISDDCSAGGLHMIDVNDPTNPTFVGCYANEGYTHDVQCIVYDGPDKDYTGQEICVASNEDRVVILDVSDKSNVQKLSKLEYNDPGYTHQGWFTEDRAYFLIDDESDELSDGIKTRTVIADVSDLDNPKVIGEHKGSNKAIDHNLYVKGDYVYQANYQAGLRVLDLAEVGSGSLTEKAYFDVYPKSNKNNFNGAWSNFPFFNSGLVVVSGIEEGMFVLKVDFSFPDEDGEGSDQDDDGDDDDYYYYDDGDDDYYYYDYDDGNDRDDCLISKLLKKLFNTAKINK